MYDMRQRAANASQIIIVSITQNYYKESQNQNVAVRRHYTREAT